MRSFCGVSRNVIIWHDLLSINRVTLAASFRVSGSERRHRKESGREAIVKIALAIMMEVHSRGVTDSLVKA